MEPSGPSTLPDENWPPQYGELHVGPVQPSATYLFMNCAQGVQLMEERIQRLESSVQTYQERQSNFDNILNIMSNCNNSLCRQLEAANEKLAKLQEMDTRTKALHLEINKVFDHIDPVLTALIQIARQSNPRSAAPYEAGFESYLAWNTENEAPDEANDLPIENEASDEANDLTSSNNDRTEAWNADVGTSHQANDQDWQVELGGPWGMEVSWQCG